MVSHAETDERIFEISRHVSRPVRRNLRDLATMGAIITSIHKMDAVLSVVMDMAIRLANGEVGLIMLEDGGEAAPGNILGGERGIRPITLCIMTAWTCRTYSFTTGETIILNELGLKGERRAFDRVDHLPADQDGREVLRSDGHHQQGPGR